MSPPFYLILIAVIIIALLPSIFLYEQLQQIKNEFALHYEYSNLRDMEVNNILEKLSKPPILDKYSLPEHQLEPHITAECPADCDMGCVFEGKGEPMCLVPVFEDDEI
jgi:hypothetical protein